MPGDSKFSDNTVADNARQHNGNVYNNTYNYDTPTRLPSTPQPITRLVPNDAAATAVRGLLHSARHGSMKNLQRYMSTLVGRPPTPEPLTQRMPDHAAVGRGLLYAARNGSLKNLHQHMSYGGNIDFTDADGRTALHWAAKNGHKNIVRSLIKAHCKLDSFSEKHGTPLCEAAKAGKASIVELLLEAGADVEAPGGWNGSPIHAACKSDSLQTLDLLLNAGARVNTSRTVTEQVSNDIAGVVGFKFYRRTCMPLCAAAFSGSAHLLPTLLSSGVDIDATSRNRLTNQPYESDENSADHKWDAAPIHEAAAGPSANCLKLLIDRGADIYTKDSDGDTLLVVTAQFNRLENLRLLFDKGFQIDAVNSSQRIKALVEAKTRQCIEILVRHGAQMSVRHTNGHSPLTLHASTGRHPCVEALLDLGVPVDEINGQGVTALFYASTRQCVDLLVHRGAQVNFRHESGLTPLIHHASSGRQTTVEALLNLDASINDQDNGGKTALDKAKQNGHGELAKYLEERGAKSGDAIAQNPRR